MDRDTLRRLEMLNQLSLTEIQKDDVIGFFDKREAEIKFNAVANTLMREIKTEVENYEKK